jgi:hypothetical protein
VPLRRQIVANESLRPFSKFLNNLDAAAGRAPSMALVNGDVVKLGLLDPPVCGKNDSFFLPPRASAHTRFELPIEPF